MKFAFTQCARGSLDCLVKRKVFEVFFSLSGDLSIDAFLVLLSELTAINTRLNFSQMVEGRKKEEVVK